jgi:hypothetical protein
MQFGSDSKRIIPQAVNGILDDSGNVVVSGDTSFGASPLGSAARSQALYGIANANFNLTPNIPENPIVDGSNPLPFWSADDLSEGRITAKMFYNETDQTFAVELNPTAGSASDAFTLTTRSYLLNDSGISLRQKAYATLTKVNAYSSTNQWNLTLSATYYDAAGVSLSSFTIGTAADNVAFTGINGFTTSGTAIVSASAQYVDLAFTLTCALAVTSTVKVQIENILLQTSTGSGGTSSFLIADTFTSSGSWVKPASVNYLVGVVVAGAGGGGGGGAILTNTGGAGTSIGGGGGASGVWTFLPNLYVGDQGTVTVGIGAAGAAGTARTFTKGVGTATTAALSGGNGGTGGVTTFGSYISVPGAGGGTGGSAGAGTPVPGTAAGTITTIVYNPINIAGRAGQGGGQNGGTATATTQGLSVFPYAAVYAGGTGGSATGTSVGMQTFRGGTGGSAGILGSGAGAATLADGGIAAGTGRNGGWGNGGASGGAVYNWDSSTLTSPQAGTAGSGGSGSAGNGAGGGGGGPVLIGASNHTSLSLTLASGAGGSGSGGLVAVIYVS